MSIRGSAVAWPSILACSIAALTYAQHTPSSATLSNIQAALNVDTAAVETPAIAEGRGGDLALTVIIAGEKRVLDLEPRSVRSPDFVVYAQDEVGGPLVEVTPPPSATYAGVVRDVPGSRVRATVRQGHITARIRLDDEVFAIQPLDELGIAAPAGAHAVYRQSDWLDAGHECGVGHAPVAPPSVGGGGDRQAAGTELLITDIAFDADFAFYDDNNQSIDQTVDRIESFMNGITGVYEEPDIGITYLIGVIIVRTSPGTYTVTSPSALLNEFQTVWTSPPENGIHRDIAHLYTGKNLNGSVIGIAQLSVICNSTGVGLSENFTSNYNSMVALTAHELGHNWSAQHCNAAADCRIMCSGLGGCDGINPLTFAESAAMQIVNKRDVSSCLTPQLPAITLPFCEDWSIPAFDPARWSYTAGATFTALGSLNPSDPFALKLNASSDSPYADDDLRSNFIDLSGQSNVVFSYHTEHIAVEAGEELIIEYWSINDEWIEINRLVSDGIDQFIYRYHEHVLPGDAYHSEFRIRFRPDVNGFTDEWLIDDISLDCFSAPVCTAGCDDGQVCTSNEVCNDNLCVGTPTDCSGAGDQCNTAACDNNGSGSNCDMLIPVLDGASCNGGNGYCQGGQCVDPASTARLFMTVDGAQAAANGLGETTLTVGQGTTTRIMVWLADNGSSGDLLNGYQVILPVSATPRRGATGTVAYRDVDPGNPGGDSIIVDTTRSDWIYADEVAILEPTYSEAPSLGVFGVFYSTIFGTGVDPSPGNDIHYLLEFDLVASAGALGEFDFAFNQGPDAPPLTGMFNTDGQEFVTEQFQPLVVTVTEKVSDCTAIADCADIDGNDIRDDTCVWWACTAGSCIGTDIVYGDMGGQFGTCPPDGTADGNDRFQALNCFADVNPGGGPYACEQNPPTAFNVDAGGQFGSCAPDGVCDGNDAFAALNAFGDTTTCSCPLGGPAPEFQPDPVVLGDATLRLTPERKRVRPGATFTVDVHLDTPLDDLRGYQLHLVPTGGSRGTVELIDIGLQRPTVLGTASTGGTWSAFNVHSGQLVVGMDQPGHPVSTGYLATYVFRASRDAAGRFAIELRHGADDATARTFLFPTLAQGQIEVTSTGPAIVEIAGRAR